MYLQPLVPRRGEPDPGGLTLYDCAAVLSHLFVFDEVYEAFAELGYRQAGLVLQMIDRALALNLGIYSPQPEPPEVVRGWSNEGHVLERHSFSELGSEIVTIQRDSDIVEVLDFSLPRRPFLLSVA